MKKLGAALAIVVTLVAATDALAQSAPAPDMASIVLGFATRGRAVPEPPPRPVLGPGARHDRERFLELEHVMSYNARNLIIAAAASAALATGAQARGVEMLSTDQSVRNVVLVHGAFVDGSGWRGVYDGLTALGYRVTIVQVPLTSLEDDVAATTRALGNQGGPTILVGHSWGGTVITEAGVHPDVVGLVYLSALAPDAGETTARQYEGYPPATEFVIDAGPDGFGFVRPDRFQSGFAADLNDADAAFLRDAQLPIRMSAFETRLNNAAWRSRPSWAIIPGEDLAFGEGMLLGMARRIGATIVETPGSHAAFITQAPAIVSVIDNAAREISQQKN